MAEKRVVVVGAGLGGLSAAAYLAKNGFEVDLFEKNHSPGGYATSFVRGEFEFEVALHGLSGIGPEENRGSCYRLLEGCDVAERVEFIPLDEIYVCQLEDEKAAIPKGWEEAEEAYGENFPEERDGLRQLMKLMRQTYDEQRIIAGKPNMFDLLTFPVRGSHLIRSMGLNLEEVMNRYLSDPELKALFGGLWPYYGLPPSLLSWSLYAIGNSSFIEHGPAQVKGTSQALSNAFTDSITDHGGRVHLRNGVKQILVKDGRVVGVVTESGDRVEADIVMSNANPITCCYDLIGAEHIPLDYLKELAGRHIAMSTFNVYLGLDCSYDELGIEHHELFVGKDNDYDKAFAARMRIGKSEGFGLACYNIPDPDFSPPGTSVVTLTAVQVGEVWERVPPERYVETKNRMAEELMDEAEKIIPGLRKHIKVMEVSTPLTNMRYTGNPGGTILGFDYDIIDSPALRLSNRGPLPGLYFANAWVRMGGGFEPCIMSGYFAFKTIVNDLEKASS